jgi:hypothetical protein
MDANRWVWPGCELATGFGWVRGRAVPRRVRCTVLLPREAAQKKRGGGGGGSGVGGAAPEEEDAVWGELPGDIQPR